MRMLLDGDESASCLSGEPGEQGGLATRSGAHVEPPTGVVDNLGSSQGQRYELAAFVLDSGATITHTGEGLRRALRQGSAQRRPARRRHLGQGQQLGEMT